MKKFYLRFFALFVALTCLVLVSCQNNQDVAETSEIQEQMTEAVTESDSESETVKVEMAVEYKLAEVADKIKMHGRMSVIDSGMTCDFTTSGIEFTVCAKGDVKLKVTPTKDTYFTVWIDGKRQEERFYAPAMATTLTLASFETRGEHTIKILKQTEAQWSLCVLNSLTFIGEFDNAPQNKDRYIEIIGDSITCGYGNLCLNGTEDAGTAIYQDGTVAFPYLTAQLFDADCSVVGCSGVGIDKGFTSFSENDFYPLTSYYRSRSAKYSFERIPDLVVINLGTNDTTKGSDETRFKTGAKSLIELIRSKYGDVNIIWTYNMMNDSKVVPWVTAVISELGGETEGLYMCQLNKNQEGGGGHPIDDAHDVAARILKKFINDKRLFD